MNGGGIRNKESSANTRIGEHKTLTTEISGYNREVQYIDTKQVKQKPYSVTKSISNRTVEMKLLRRLL
jgi:hypothetical protein